MSKELKAITMEELVQNNGEDGSNLWVLIAGKVYDVTNFKHPGGKDVLNDVIGEDREDEFESIHSPAAKEEMKKYVIGYLKEDEKSKDHKKTDGDKKDAADQSGLIFIFLFITLAIGVVFYLFKS